MATITCSIGQSASLLSLTPNSCTAVSGETNQWDVTFSESTPWSYDPKVGDTYNATDYMGSSYVFLFIPVSSGYRLQYVSGGWSADSPCNVTDMMGDVVTGTVNRAFSTLSSWESSLDSGDFANLYSSGDDAVGECYDDADDFNWNVDISGASSLGNVKLTVAVGERHGGDASSGVTIKYTGNSRKTIYVNRDDVTVEYLVVDCTSANNQNYEAIAIAGGAGTDVIVRQNIVHGYNSQNDRLVGIWSLSGGNSSDTRYIVNNVVYDFYQNNDNALGISCVDSGQQVFVYNNTIYKIHSGSNSKYGAGMNLRGTPKRIFNNVAMDCVNGNSSSTYSKCFRWVDTTPTDTQADYNYGSDTTFVGSNGYQSETVSGTFQSVTGAIDLSLVSTSDATTGGTDLGTTAGVNVDVTGYDRSSASDWSIGAYQFQSSGTTVTPASAVAIATVASPTVTVGLEITPSAATVIATGTNPTITSGIELSPATAVAIAVGNAPSIESGIELTPSSAAAVATGNAPTITSGIELVPSLCVAIATATNPSVSGGIEVTPANAVAVAEAASPTVTEGDPGGTTITPSAAVCVGTAVSPSIESGITIQPSEAVGVATGVSPTISSGSTLSGIVAAAIATSPNPTVTTGGDVLVTPSPAVIIATASILPLSPYGILYISNPAISIPEIGSAAITTPSASSTIVSSKEK